MQVAIQAGVTGADAYSETGGVIQDGVSDLFEQQKQWEEEEEEDAMKEQTKEKQLNNKRAKMLADRGARKWF